VHEIQKAPESIYTGSLCWKEYCWSINFKLFILLWKSGP